MSASPPEQNTPNGQSESSGGIISWFAHNHVAANLLMVFIIAVGLLSMTQIRRELNPDLTIDVIQVSVAYPGASPEEVDNGVTSKIEEAIKDITGIESYNSYTKEGFTTLYIDVLQSFDVSDVLDQVKNRIDGITNLPDQSENPTIEQLDFKIPAIQIQIHGAIDEKNLNVLLRQMRKEILTLPEISSADIFGLRDYEISIEVSENTLKKYRLSLRDVANAINNSSFDLAGGAIQSDTGDILLRTQGQAFKQKDFEDIILRTFADGTRLRLGDVAHVRDEFTQGSGLTLFDREYGAGIMVYAVGEQDVIDTTNIVKKYANQKRLELPDTVKLSYWQDLSYYIDGRLDLMGKNLAIGALLVFTILLVLLNFKLAFWVMAGLPVCFLGTIAMIQLNFIDVTLNMVSLFGFITVLGIMVDDAIIIGESIDSTTREQGNTLDAVIAGAKRVAIPATFGVLTTVASFIPTVTLSGVFAPMPAAIGWVVIFCLLFSLIESKLILPAHIAHSRITQLPGLRTISEQSDKVSTLANKWLRRFIDNLYLPFLARCIANRYTTLASFLAALIVTGGLVASGIVLLVIVPVSPSDFLSAKAEMIEGTPDKKTHEAVARLSDALYAANDEYIERSGIEGGFIKHAYTWGVAGDYAEFTVELTKHEDRDVDSYEIVDLWREKTGVVPGSRSVVFKSQDDSFGDPISFNIISDNETELVAAANELREILGTYEGIYDRDSTLSNQLDEINLDIKPSAEALGLSLRDLGMQVRDAFYGVEAQRMQRGNDEVKVMVRYPRDERKSLSDLDNMHVRTAEGDEVPFYAVADVVSKPSYASIDKIDGRRAVNVSAKIDKVKYNPDAVSAQIMSNDMPKLLEKYPSINYEPDGEAKESRRLAVGLLQGFALAIIGVYALLAIPLKSYTQPLIIMAVIPFSLIGAVIGHLIFDTAFSMMSFFGVIALTGVVVNDSLILTDAINKRMADQTPMVEAVLASCKQRFRAILITSLTTFFGLFPMLLENSLQAQSMLPMAISLAFGIVFATVITLLLIPCLFLILNDLIEWQSKPISDKAATSSP